MLASGHPGCRVPAGTVDKCTAGKVLVSISQHLLQSSSAFSNIPSMLASGPPGLLYGPAGTVDKCTAGNLLVSIS